MGHQAPEVEIALDAITTFLQRHLSRQKRHPLTLTALPYLVMHMNHTAA